ncbi:unnamed protein product, partial [Amoebophrya sp. A25]
RQLLAEENKRKLLIRIALYVISQHTGVPRNRLEQYYWLRDEGEKSHFDEWDHVQLVLSGQFLQGLEPARSKQAPGHKLLNGRGRDNKYQNGVDYNQNQLQEPESRKRRAEVLDSCVRVSQSSSIQAWQNPNAANGFWNMRP